MILMVGKMDAHSLMSDSSRCRAAASGSTYAEIASYVGQSTGMTPVAARPMPNRMARSGADSRLPTSVLFCSTCREWERQVLSFEDRCSFTWSMPGRQHELHKMWSIATY